MHQLLQKVYDKFYPFAGVKTRFAMTFAMTLACKFIKCVVCCVVLVCLWINYTYSARGA